jgi:DNA-3-methyladenine glycosylase II
MSWFHKTPSHPNWNRAQKHLAASDPGMKRIVARVGTCTLHPRRDYFIILCHSIFSQQLSVKIADILFKRFRSLFPNNRPTPKRVIKLLSGETDEVTLKKAGLSRQKRGYVLDLARHFERGEIPTRRFAHMTDDEIIESLTRVKGIGRWTAEMFLLFVLNRPDVWPVDDLGLREAIKRLDKHKARPKAKDCVERGDCFRPYRSIATWYLWRSLALPPVQMKKAPA